MAPGFGGGGPALPPGVLAARATPAAAGVQEVIPWIFYDTQLYTSTTTVQQRFFQALPAGNDRTLSNMEQAGSLPHPYRFQIRQVCLDLWSNTLPVSDGASVAGVLRDAALLMYVGRPTFTLIINQKSYGPLPALVLHGLGGPQGIISWGGATTIQYARNETSPGWSYDDMLILQPLEPFEVQLNWAAAQTLVNNHQVRISLVGMLNRKVQ